MASVNDALLDEAIGHQIALTRYSNGVVRRIMGLLNRSDERLFLELTAALDRLPAESFTVQRLEGLLASVRGLNAQAYSQVEEELRRELREFVEYEAAYQTKVLEEALPARISVASVTAEQAYAAAMARPFQGGLLRNFMSEIAADKAKRIRQGVAQGYIEGKTTQQIVRELRGTKAKGYSDGAIEGTRRNVEAVVRTALGHMAGVTRDRFEEANSDLIKQVVWTSTLDSRTTPLCRLRDSKRYTAVDHKPVGHTIPWGAGPGRLHWCCRSVGVPVVKSWRELGFDMDEFTPSTRASMNGQVPADLTYADWLKKQNTATQDQVLGRDKGALFRTGQLPLDKFYNDKGKTLTLKELKAAEPTAYRRAGLDLPYRPPRGMPQDEIAKFLADQHSQDAMLERLYGDEGMVYSTQRSRVVAVKEDQGYRSSVESLAAVRYYTGSGYTPINRRMRETGGTLEDRQFSALTVSSFRGIGEFKGEIWRAPTTKPANAEKWWEKAVVGQHLVMGEQLQSFSRSASMSAGWASRADVLLRVDSSKFGVYIDPLSLNEGEQEVLLPPGLRYRVVGKSTKDVDGRQFRVIDLEIESGE